MLNLLVLLQKFPDVNNPYATFFFIEEAKKRKAAESAGNPVIATVTDVCGLCHVMDVLKET